MESAAEQQSIGYMETHTSADAPGCPGQQQTAGPEVNPSQHRSRETEAGFACSDGSIQTLSGALNPSFPSFGHGEKGTEVPHRHDHVYHGPSQPRHDSIDSIASSMFSVRFKSRTNTGFSSIATSILEGGDPETLKEEDEDDDIPLDDPSAPPNVPSSPAPKSFLPRAQTFQSPTPSRSGSLIQDLEGSALTHHPAVNLVSLARSSSPTPASQALAMPKEKSLHKHTRFEPSPSLSRRSSLPIRPLAGHAGSPSALRRSSEHPSPSPSPSAPSLPAPPGFGLRRAATRPSRLVMDWDRSSSPGDPLTPVPETEAPDSQAETVEGSASSAEPRDTDMAMTGQSGDGSSEAGTAPGTPLSDDDITPGEYPHSDSSSVRNLHLDGRTAEDICDLILERTHGMQLRDLVVMQDEAWAAVNHCVDALTHIVDANAALPGQTSIPIRQRAPGVVGGNHGTWGGSNGGGGGGGFNNFNGGFGDSFNGNHGGQPPAGYSNGNGNGLDGGGAGGQGNGGPPMNPNPKRKMEDDTSKQMFCCPFRKRNPVKFNVRNFQTCATQSFPDISQVKRHVKTFHRRNSGIKFRCPRCKKSYDSADTLGSHLLAPSAEMCQVRDKADEESDGDPEAGISASTIEILNERKQNTKIDSWETLWKRLFPADKDIKNHEFIPPVELDEVREDFDRHWDGLRADLEDELGAVSAHVLDGVADRCREHIRNVLEISQDRANEGRRFNKRRRQGSKPSMSGQGEPGPAEALGHRPAYASLPGGSSNTSIVSPSPVDEPPETNDTEMWSQPIGSVQASMPGQNYGSLSMPAPPRAVITVAPFHGPYGISRQNQTPKGQSPDQLDSAKGLDTPAGSAPMDNFFVPPGATEFDEQYTLELANQYSHGANGYYQTFQGMQFGNGPG